MIEHIVNWITAFISAHGYPGVLVLMALESACIPIPSEAIMGFAGAQISAPVGNFHPDIHVLAIIGAAGNLVGSIIAYWVGYVGGRPFLEKYGKFLLIRQRDLKKTDQFFRKYGEITVLASRVLPIVRTFISLPAGIAKMNFARFCAYTFIGALPFCYLLAWGGVKLGQHWDKISAVLHKADLGISAALVILFGIWLWHHLRPDNKADSATEVNAASGTKSA